MLHRLFSCKSGVLISFFLMVSLMPGCQKIKRLLKKPPEEVVQETRNVKMWGYEQTVTVDASLEDVNRYLSESPESLSIEGVEAGDGGQELGSTFPFKVKRMGIEVEGPMILVKSGEGKLWHVWHNPHIFQLQRWEFKEMKNGSRITFVAETEVIEALEKMPGIDKMAERVLKDIDLMLAGVQAEFDPELEAADFVEKGLRGDSYEKLYKLHESRVWIDASPEEVEKWMEENTEEYMSEYEQKGECPTAEESSKPVLYCCYTANFGGFKTDVHTFTINNEDDRRAGKLYWTASGIVGWLEWGLEKAAGGTLYYSSLALEVPGEMTPLGVEALMVLARVSKNMKESMLKVKNGVEGGGEI